VATFFELTTEPMNIADQAKGAVNVARWSLGTGARSARRPLRGLEIKEDTHAVLKVVDMVGRPVPLVDAGSLTGKVQQTTNFILQSVQEARQEKHQVIETFGLPYIFFYGEQPRYLDCAAVLINSLDFNWQAEFWENYENNFRGTKCAESGSRVYLLYDDNIVEGYMINAAAAVDAMNPMAVQLSFRLFVTTYRNCSHIGDPKFPIRMGVNADTRRTAGNIANAAYRARVVDGGLDSVVTRDALQKKYDALRKKYWEYLYRSDQRGQNPTKLQKAMNAKKQAEDAFDSLGKAWNATGIGGGVVEGVSNAYNDFTGAVEDGMAWASGQYAKAGGVEPFKTTIGTYTDARETYYQGKEAYRRGKKAFDTAAGLFGYPKKKQAPPGKAVRGLIYDNQDEWTGPQTCYDINTAAMKEADDLVRTAVDKAAANATNMNNVDTIADSQLDKANRGEGGSAKAPAKKPDGPAYGPNPATDMFPERPPPEGNTAPPKGPPAPSLENVIAAAGIGTGTSSSDVPYGGTTNRYDGSTQAPGSGVHTSSAVPEPRAPLTTPLDRR
jgi:hypothetical protein